MRRLFSPMGLIVVIISLAVVVVLTATLIPQQLHLAYRAAVDFVNAAGNGDDAAAMSELSDDVRAYIADNCPDGSVSACVDAYTPPEWGGFLNAVFRRAQPDGADAWDILLLATYEDDQGFSGVCIYNRAERVTDDTWEIVRWSGWVSCDLPNAGLSSLASDADAPNRVPPTES